MYDLLEYKKELFQDVDLDSAISESYPEESFFDLACETLSDAGILDDFEHAPYRDMNKGIKFDGYSWNELEKVFCGIIVEYDNEPEDLKRISKSEIESLAKRAVRFVEKTAATNYRESMDESSIGRSTGDLISSLRDDIHKFRIIVITDRVISDRVKNISIDPIDEKPTSIEVWDLERLMKLARSDQETEEFTVDLTKSNCKVQVIEASRLDDGTVTYVGVMPGKVLAGIYDEYGQRLLESNVRTFLDFRAKPNQAMRRGLVLEPENFFAYNNGITVTASSAEIEKADGKTSIKSLDNMQIVNGGQTTATIYFTPNEPGGIDTENGRMPYRKVDLDRVSVQMKLTVLNTEDAEYAQNYKANISKSANFQSAVNESDLTSNSPFHKDMERLSRKTSMPIADVGYQTKWFYERARGQYSTKKRGLGAGALNRFVMEYPKSQVFTKDQLNKYEVIWQMHPHIAKSGTNPSRHFFMSQMAKKYDENPSFRIEADFYQDIISKMILFKQIDKAILKADWYISERGHKAEAVTYAIALVRKKLNELGKEINLALIYQNQSVPRLLEETMLNVASLIRKNIMDSNFRAGSGNVTEFCKHENGWKRIQTIDIDLSSLEYPLILEGNQVQEDASNKAEIAKASSQVSDFDRVMSISATEWEKLASYNLKSYSLESPQVKLPMMCAKLHRGGRMLTDKQLRFVLKIYNSSIDEGFEFGK